MASIWRRGGSRGRVRGVSTPPPHEMKKASYSLLQFVYLTAYWSVTSFLSGAPSPKKNPGSTPVARKYARIFVYRHFLLSEKPTVFKSVAGGKRFRA